ncbi:DUF3995 domain-containing protein [Nonomuraea rhodomycinica]|uniref:DUF3995 domain-containing protein n=1 Tax=Nonomuraea rhodomycinica TaxID=1712872 RepID=A0A7Y6MA13_9ACTN|nr:DUF3995 domain-containing protein [Nonomuraea rhodomycinica]NUW40142.1 DUF3995 domain-containing protein [Nonomuraea rhodomycinica]
MNTSRLGTLTAAVLLTDAAAHLYWLTGRTWPAHDVRSLSLAVLNMEVPFTPRVLVPLAVALTTGAVAVLACSRGRGGLPARMVTGAVAAGTLARAAAGLAWILGIGADTATPFYWLNLIVYTPLCAAMATSAAMIAARRPGRAARPSHPAGRPAPLPRTAGRAGRS